MCRTHSITGKVKLLAYTELHTRPHSRKFHDCGAQPWIYQPHSRKIVHCGSQRVPQATTGKEASPLLCVQPWTCCYSSVVLILGANLPTTVQDIFCTVGSQLFSLTPPKSESFPHMWCSSFGLTHHSREIFWTVVFHLGMSSSSHHTLCFPNCVSTHHSSKNFLTVVLNCGISPMPWTNLVVKTFVINTHPIQVVTTT